MGASFPAPSSSLRHRPTPALPFKNRETECFELACILLENRRKVINRPNNMEQSQYRLKLATSGQMFGSGKSTFGANFLSRLKQQPDNLAKLRTTYRELVDEWLLGLVHVVVDFRDLNIGLQFISALRSALITALLGLQVSKESRLLLQNMKSDLDSNGCQEILSKFGAAANMRFLLHLDEVNILQGFQNSGLPSDGKLLYDMWHEISQVHNHTDSALFCSGRTPLLYLFGKGMGASFGGQRSPDDAECIFLDPLGPSHVSEIFAEFSVFEEHEFVCKLHAATAGVPRFIAHAVDFFSNRQDGDDSTDFAARRSMFLQDQAPFIAHLNAAAFHEMSPLRFLDQEAIPIFLEMIRVAALCLPVQLHTVIDGTPWGMEGNVLTLKICSSFPVYIKRGPSDYHFVVIPPVVLDQIANSSIDARTPYWKSMHAAMVFPSAALSSGDLLELMALQCLRLRVSEELVASPASICHLLPFLRDSRVANHTFTPGLDVFKQFPKITRTPNAGKAPELLKKFFDDPSSAGFSDVHPDDIASLVKWMEPGGIYLPRPQSASADLMHLSNDPNTLVEWQFKNGAQKITQEVMVHELNKSFCSYFENVVFVMVALNTDFSDLPDGTNVVNNSLVLAHQYGTGCTFQGVKTSFTVPAGLEVILVTENGLLEFLTPQNVEVLRGGILSLDVLNKAIDSPSRKKRSVDSI